MKTELQTKENPWTLLEFITLINKTENLTASVSNSRSEDESFTIQVETLNEDTE